MRTRKSNQTKDSAPAAAQRNIGQRYRPLRDEVLEELRNQILDGERPPGTFLNETALAGELGVSRLPVREAIRQLESAGLVTSVPRRGVRVADPNVSEYAVVHQIRVALELLAVKLTIERHDENVLDALADMVDEGKMAARKGDHATLHRLNLEFHELLSDGSASPTLSSLVSTIRHQARHLAGGFQTPDELSWDEHAAIIEAIIAGRTRDAVTLMRRHLNDRHSAVLASAAPGDVTPE